MSDLEPGTGADAHAGAADSLGYDEWCEALRDGTLLAQTCNDCERVYGTPVSVCDSCGSRALETTALPTTGEVYTETTVNVPPVAFEGPYQVGLVQLGDARVMARLDGNGDSGDGNGDSGDGNGDSDGALGGIDIGDVVELVGVVEHDGDPAPVFAPPQQS